MHFINRKRRDICLLLAASFKNVMASKMYCREKKSIASYFAHQHQVLLETSKHKQMELSTSTAILQQQQEL